MSLPFSSRVYKLSKIAKEFESEMLRMAQMSTTRTDPVMDLLDKYKDRLMQEAANASAGKSVRNVDLLVNWDGNVASFVIEAMGPDAAEYAKSGGSVLNLKFRAVLNQVTGLLKKEKVGAIKFQVIEGMEFSSE